MTRCLSLINSRFFSFQHRSAFSMSSNKSKPKSSTANPHPPTFLAPSSSSLSSMRRKNCPKSTVSNNLNATVFLTPSISTLGNPNASFVTPASSNVRNRDRLKPTTSNNPNASMFVAPSSSLSSRGRTLNETCILTASRKPHEKVDESSELQLTFAYNEYLQSLMKQLIVQEKIKKNKEILDGQIRHYGNLLFDKQGVLKNTLEDTENVEKQQKVNNIQF